MSETRDLVFHDERRRILEGVKGWLLKHFPKRGLVIGGGTILASRWSHRVSTDCDMFADEQAFREVDVDALRHEVDARLGSGELLRARLRQSLATQPKPLLDPHCSELALNLEDFSVQLFQLGAAEFNRRHGDMIRTGLTVEQKGLRR